MSLDIKGPNIYVFEFPEGEDKVSVLLMVIIKRIDRHSRSFISGKAGNWYFDAYTENQKFWIPSEKCFLKCMR